jgi:hypothetical protein
VVSSNSKLKSPIATSVGHLIHFDSKRLQSILAALKDQNASSMVNSTTSGHFDLPPCQNRFRSFSSEKQLLEAPYSHRSADGEKKRAFRAQRKCLQPILMLPQTPKKSTQIPAAHD